jgi:hypothetical protein
MQMYEIANNDHSESTFAKNEGANPGEVHSVDVRAGMNNLSNICFASNASHLDSLTVASTGISIAAVQSVRLQPTKYAHARSLHPNQNDFADLSSECIATTHSSTAHANLSSPAKPIPFHSNAHKTSSNRLQTAAPSSQRKYSKPKDNIIVNEGLSTLQRPWTNTNYLNSSQNANYNRLISRELLTSVDPADIDINPFELIARNHQHNLHQGFYSKEPSQFNPAAATEIDNNHQSYTENELEIVTASNSLAFLDCRALNKNRGFQPLQNRHAHTIGSLLLKRQREVASEKRNQIMSAKDQINALRMAEAIAIENLRRQTKTYLTQN